VSETRLPSTPPQAGPEHDVLRSDVGSWETLSETRMAPEATAQMSRGTATNRLACGGRWLISEFKNDTGFEGHGVYGYDAAKGKYTGVWFDATRTSVVVLEGTYDAATRVMTMHGALERPDGTTLRWREVTERPNPDTRIFRSFMPGTEGEFEMLTVTYHRRRM
jgi:hypothetical protein